MSARPGETVEGITVPLGDPDALLAAGRQLESAGFELQLAAAQIARTPTLMSGWAGSGSSAFAELTGSPVELDAAVGERRGRWPPRTS